MSLRVEPITSPATATARSEYSLLTDRGTEVAIVTGQRRALQMAAASDLLKALRVLLPRGWGTGHMDHMHGVKAARMAIARAGAKPR